MQMDWIMALAGGALIGGAVSLMLLWNGRVTGISGIFYGLLGRPSSEMSWRLWFVGGLLLGGLVLSVLRPQSFGAGDLEVRGGVLLAGILVGFGTVLGSGCTSGHGVCGVSRLSPRSFLATLIFVLFGILTVSTLRVLGVLP